MIKILLHSTHMKFYFNNASEEEEQKAKSILTTRFKARDTSMNHDYRVKKGLIDNVKNFYIDNHNMLPSGFILPVKEYFDKASLDYEIVDMRQFPKPDMEFLKKLKAGKVEIGRDTKTGKPYVPREHQIEAVLSCVQAKHGIVWAPMGFGKSFCMYLLTKVFPKTKIIFLFSSIDILMQTYNVFVNEYQHDPNEIGVIQGSNRDDDKRIILLSIFSYQKAFHLFNDFRIAICDEVHETGVNDTSELILHSMQNCAMRFGFSATPKHDNPYRSMKAYANIGPIIYRKKIKEQIDIGTLAKTGISIITYECQSLPVIRSYSDVYETLAVTKKRTEEDLVKAGFEIIEKKNKKYGRRFIQYGNETTHYVNNNVRNNIIAQLAIERSKNGKRVLILFSKIKQGENIKQILDSVNIESMLIHGKHDKQEKKEAELYLRTRPGAIVLASSIWNTGIDIEEIDVYINAAGGVSSIEAIQKLGRVIRKSKTTNKHIAEVIDFDDSVLSPLGRKQSQTRIQLYENEELPIKYENYIEKNI